MPRRPRNAVENDVQEEVVEETQVVEEEVTQVEEEPKGVAHTMLLNVLHDGTSYKKGESVVLSKGLVRLFRQKGFIA